MLKYVYYRSYYENDKWLIHLAMAYITLHNNKPIIIINLKLILIYYV